MPWLADSSICACQKERASQDEYNDQFFEDASRNNAGLGLVNVPSEGRRRLSRRSHRFERTFIIGVRPADMFMDVVVLLLSLCLGFSVSSLATPHPPFMYLSLYFSFSSMHVSVLVAVSLCPFYTPPRDALAPAYTPARCS